MKLTAYVQAVEEAQRELADLRSKVGPLNKRIVDLEAFLQGARALVPTDTHTNGGPPRGGEKVLWEQVRDILREADRPMRVAELHTELTRRGWKNKSKSPGNAREVIRGSVLRRTEVFENVGGGLFDLVERKAGGTK